MGTQRLAHDYYSFICNSQKLETTQISINRSMDQYIVVLRNELCIHATWITSIMLKERNQVRVDTKGCHLYKILENTHHGDKQINDCQYKGKGRDRREEVDFGKR